MIKILENLVPKISGPLGTPGPPDSRPHSLSYMLNGGGITFQPKSIVVGGLGEEERKKLPHFITSGNYSY
ncbi:MAG: hypothetical protein ACE5GI_04215 [Candidatus Aminicenantales bacterium]